MKIDPEAIAKMKRIGATDTEIEFAEKLDVELHTKIYNIIDNLDDHQVIHTLVGLITGMVQNKVMDIDDVYRLVNMHEKIRELILNEQ